MAERWEHERDRGVAGRAADEVRSWFGDDEAQRRRERDERYERPHNERGWNVDPSRPREYHAASPQERWAGREGYAERDYRYAGETALGRPDWGNRQGSYEDRDRFWRDRGSTEPRSRTVYSGPVHWRDDSTHMNYAGMGPRGYRRSDQRMLEDVCDRLTDDAGVNASDIEVKCHEGVVTLTGSVQSREEKRRAEDIAESITGIHDVHNNLRVSTGVIGTPGAPQTPLGLSSPGGESRTVVNEAETAKRR
jgi:hypothetical protein